MSKFKGKCIRQRILKPHVIVEGITENKYLKKLFLDKITILGGKNANDSYSTAHITSTKNAIEDALNAGVKCYWLVDLDRLYIDKEDRKKELDNYNQLKNKYSDNTKVVFCDSMPSIEYWFLLHFREGNPLFAKIGDDSKELLKYIPHYDKSKVEDYQQLYNQEKIDNAILRAKKIKYDNDSQTHTNVWKIVEQLFVG